MISRHRLLSLLVAASLILAAGCGLDDDDEYGEEEGTETTTEVAQNSNGAPTEFVRIEDPVENCFTVEVPKGWANQAYMSRAYDVHREVITSISPNGDTLIFMGDPSSLHYYNMQAMTVGMDKLIANHPFIRVQEYVRAADYFESYATKKFGKLDDFQITGMTENPEIVAFLTQRATEVNLQLKEITAVDLKFTFTDKGEKRSAILIGSTYDLGNLWMVSVSGISTAGDPESYRATLMHMANSHTTNPAWRAKQKELHEQRMAELRQTHANNMNWIQQSAQRHQARMQAIWARNDASMKNYWERSAASDRSHRSFLNYINDESTVVGANGETRQVDNSYQRYFVNKNDNSYVGGDAHFDGDGLRKMGLNPDDYEEMKVRP